MMMVYVGEQHNGRIKFTDDKDTLAADLFRVEQRTFVDLEHLQAVAAVLEDRGWHVCVDTDSYFYESGESKDVLPIVSQFWMLGGI